MENHHVQWLYQLFLWQFSIAMLNIQRVDICCGILWLMKLLQFTLYVESEFAHSCWLEVDIWILHMWYTCANKFKHVCMCIYAWHTVFLIHTIYIYNYWFIYLSIYLAIHPSIRPSVHPSIHPSSLSIPDLSHLSHLPVYSIQSTYCV